MLVEITKASLMSALQHVLKAVAVNSPIPILQGINIQACVEGIVLTASNSSMTIQSIAPQDGVSISVQKTGAVVIPARYFYDVIRKLPDGMIVLELKKQRLLTVTSGHSQIRLCGMDATHFPSINNREQPSSHKLRINNALLRSAIKQVTVAASTSETRPVLTGVSLEYNNDSLTLMATDGVRLASRTLPIEHDASERFNAIIPAKNLYEVSKMLIDDDAATEIAVSHHRVTFIAKGLQAESALIEGTFPSIKNIIPPSYLCEILVDRSSLLTAVECVTVLANESVIRLVVGSDTLKLLSRTAEIGDVENEVPLLEMSGEEFVISLNGKFFIDILRNIDCSSVRIQFSGNISPIVVLPHDPLMSTVFLITPVRVRD